MRYAILLCALGLSISGCVAMAMKMDETGLSPDGAGGHALLATAGESVVPLAADDPDELVPAMSAVQPRKVTYTGTLQVAVLEPTEAVRRTRELTEAQGGYMQRMAAAAIVIRVPAEKFDETIAAIEAMGMVIAKDIVAQDVTDQFVDLELRLRNNRTLLATLEGMLARAEDVKQALEVEKELARVRTEIERLEGKLNLLLNRISFSTISVAFPQTAEAPSEMRVNLPFWWLKAMGLKSLMTF